MKRPLSHTYLFITRKLSKRENLSVRKQMCLAFLHWGTTQRKPELLKFVELAKLWRKTECRIGQPRTIIEVRARKLFLVAKKEKLRQFKSKLGKRIGEKLKRENKGVCSEEHRYKGHFSPSERIAHYWMLYPPEGEPFVVYNLRAFCREHGLRQNHMVATAVNPIHRKYHKGWRAEKLDPLWVKVNGGG